MYNKTLFAQYGWETPHTFDEFVALCLRIREDTGGEVEPWNPNAKYSSELLLAMEAFTYEELFGGADNRSWYNSFVKGNATFAGHMEPYYEALRTLIDNGILREEHFAYSATTRGKEFAAGKIAMINGVISDYDNDEYDFGFMPFPTTAGELGYISDTYNCLLGVPLKEHSAAVQDAIKRFLEFFSSEEGQRVFIGDALKSSNVKNVKFSQTGDLAALQPVIDEGHMFAVLDFNSDIGYRNISLHQDAIDMTTGTRTAAQCLTDADIEPYTPVTETAEEPPEALATATENMTILETSFYIADMYREKAGADIGLIANNIAYRGNLMRIFGGDVTPAFVNVFKPRSFDNDAALTKVSMTGAQLMEALNNVPTYNNNIADCIYAYSGLVCEIAPWAPMGEKYLSVKLPDGSALVPDKLYTVAAWSGTVSERYITEVLETCEGTWEELMTAKLKADGTVSPADDGRITLVWD